LKKRLKRPSHRPKRNKKIARYIEKSGESIKEAIIILDVKNNIESIATEYEYLERKFGKREKD